MEREYFNHEFTDHIEVSDESPQTDTVQRHSVPKDHRASERSVKSSGFSDLQRSQCYDMQQITPVKCRYYHQSMSQSSVTRRYYTPSYTRGTASQSCDIHHLYRSGRIASSQIKSASSRHGEAINNQYRRNSCLETPRGHRSRDRSTERSGHRTPVRFNLERHPMIMRTPSDSMSCNRLHILNSGSSSKYTSYASRSAPFFNVFNPASPFESYHFGREISEYSYCTFQDSSGGLDQAIKLTNDHETRKQIAELATNRNTGWMTRNSCLRKWRVKWASLILLLLLIIVFSSFSIYYYTLYIYERERIPRQWNRLSFPHTLVADHGPSTTSRLFDHLNKLSDEDRQNTLKSLGNLLINMRYVIDDTTRIELHPKQQEASDTEAEELAVEHAEEEPMVIEKAVERIPQPIAQEQTIDFLVKMTELINAGKIFFE